MTKKRILITALVIAAVFFAIPKVKSIADSLSKETGYQFNVDGEKWFIISDKEVLNAMLTEYRNQYLTNIDRNAAVKNVRIRQKIEIMETEVKPEEMTSPAAAKEKIYALEKEAVVIEVQKGDNLWNIARTNQITVADLEKFNPDIDPDKIFPGDKLVINPFDPVLDVVIEMENTVTESIPFKIEYQNDHNLYKNQRTIIKEGIEGEKEVTYNINLLNGYQSSITVQDEKIVKEPEKALVKIGTKTTVSRGGRINYGVVSGTRISSSYGSRIHPITGKRTFHDGVDIAAPYGNNVYAYSAGKVMEAGWNGGYGNSILIDHGNGLKTRYGHLSKISVRVGQKVGTGDKIGSVGSTGNSTGPHLHFEVIKNGQTKNPLNYI
ncbi:MAG: peptidoglycan DD-metalloendopeptidase family protein [Peptococcaceae bacterium]